MRILAAKAESPLTWLSSLSEEYIKKLFDEYKDKNDLLDLKNFGENIYEKNSKEFMTKLKDKVYSLWGDAIEDAELSNRGFLF